MEKEVQKIATGMKHPSSSSSLLSEAAPGRSRIKIVYRTTLPSKKAKDGGCRDGKIVVDNQDIIIDRLNNALMKSIPNIANHSNIKSKQFISKNSKYLLTINILKFKTTTSYGSSCWWRRRLLSCCGCARVKMVLKVSWKLTTTTTRIATTLMMTTTADNKPTNIMVLAEGSSTKKLCNSSKSMNIVRDGEDDNVMMVLLDELTAQISKEISHDVIEGIVLYIRTIRATAPAAAA